MKHGGWPIPDRGSRVVAWSGRSWLDSCRWDGVWIVAAKVPAGPLLGAPQPAVQRLGPDAEQRADCAGRPRQLQHRLAAHQASRLTFWHLGGCAGLESGSFDLATGLVGPLERLAMPPIQRRPVPPPKTCVSCHRPFTWRKKWERDWQGVRYCSDACRRRGPQEFAPAAPSSSCSSAPTSRGRTRRA